MTDKKELKPGWRKVKFGDVVRLSKARSQNPLVDGYERYVGLEHLEPGDLRIRGWGNVADGTTFTNVFKPGQVLFGKRRAYQRKVAVADFSGVCSSDIYVLESQDANVLLPDLLPFVCQTDAFFEHAVGTSAGSLSPRTNWSSLADFEFALPPMDKQRQQVQLLLSLQACHDSLGEVCAQAKVLASSLYQAFTDVNTDLINLGSLMVDGPQNGLYVPATKYGNGTPILRIDAFYDGWLVNAEKLKRIDIDHETANKYSLKEDDLVVNRVNSREFVGKTVRITGLQEQTVFESNMMRFAVRSDLVEAEYVNVFLNSPLVKRQVLGRCKDAINQSSINQDDVCSIKIPKADLVTQRRFLGQLADFRAAMSESKSRMRQTKNLETLVLHKLFDAVQKEL